ncbi:Uncharacterized protein SCF082_LOCUS36466 [Durusdinium trenchii]|uniref:Uncharacterized protein n=1 Tax=Durusdinium trenchii TaxID=1381693 RepID=A0ABP0PGI7_9DINO
MASDEKPPGYLDGHSPEQINAVSSALIVGMLVVPIIGGILDRTICKRYSAHSREPMWVWLLIILSYGYLIPGLVEVLFSFNIVFDMGSKGYYGIGPGGSINKAPPTTETMLGLIRLLNDTGGQLGAALVIIYAIVIPIIKLLLTFFGNTLQLASCGNHRRASRRCIQVVQNISKWACPDMFAYIILMHLVRSLTVPPYFKANGRLDIGFTYFSLFCLGSTVASLGIRVPDREHFCFQQLGKLLGPRRLIFVTMSLSVAFFILFFCGLSQTVMSLKVANSLPDLVKMVLSFVGLKPEDLESEVNVFDLIHGLAQETFEEGKVTSFVGFIMFCVFVIGMTLVDIMALMAASIAAHNRTPAARWMQLSWIVKKLSMVDVMCMGVLVVTLCFSMYREYVIVTMGIGQWLLVAAEVVHYFTYYTVKGVIEVTEKVDLGQTAKGDEETDLSSDESSTDEEEVI